MSENTRFYPSLRAFQAADPRRRASPRRDLGRRWRGHDGATYHAAWVQETGELYVVRNGHPLRGGGVTEVAARRFGPGELRSALAGHEVVCGSTGSLGWLLDRIRYAP